MADDANTDSLAQAVPAESVTDLHEVTDTVHDKSIKGPNGTVPDESEGVDQVATDAPANSTEVDENAEKQSSPSEAIQEKATDIKEDTTIQGDATSEDAPALDAEAADLGLANKSKVPARRKSFGVPEHKKKLNKKASKAKITHTDAKPGDYFYVRLKGYPLWPGIVCDESMLPATLLKTRPVTAAREDGTYRADYQDGGPKVKDRVFPMMYLHTNEFSWIPNFDLLDLDPATVGEVTPKMRKDLAEAHVLAAEQNDLDYFKNLLLAFMEQKEAERSAKEAARIERAEKAAEKAASKKIAKKASKANLAASNDDVDAEMPDAPPSEDLVDATPISTKKAKSKKRPAEEDTNTPSDSSKKVKLSFKVKTPKDTNGETATPKAAKEGTPKSTKPKATKKAAAKVEPEVTVPREPELSAEEKRAKKDKEILFLRHKLQKGLLSKDQDLKEDEMKQMSEFITKLEGYADLEVSIIRATKINKVLKAILKLPTIPKEEDFRFKPRSQTLLDKWNKLLATESTPSAAATTTNGNTELKSTVEKAKASPTGSTNGVQELAAKDDPSKAQVKAEQAVAENSGRSEDKSGEAKDAPGAVVSTPSPSDLDAPKEMTAGDSVATEAST